MELAEELRAFLAGAPHFIAKIEESALSAGLEAKVSIAEIHIIDKIGPEGSAKMGSVAKSLGITLATLTVACDRLEQKELVQRRRDSGDKRAVSVSLTPKGLVAYGFHRTFYENLIEQMQSGLSPEQQDGLAAGIQNINRYLSGFFDD